MPELNGIRASDLWGVPFDGESTLGWPGSRYAPERVRQRAGWINMRIKDGRIYQLETDTIHGVGEGLLVDRGDVEISRDTVATSRRPARRLPPRCAPGAVRS